MPSIPAIAVAAAALLGIERPGGSKLAGIALSIAGALVLLDLTSFSLREGMALGNLLVLLNCVSYAFFLVLAKPVLRRIPPLTVIAWTFVFGGTGVALVSAAEAAYRSAVMEAIYKGAQSRKWVAPKDRPAPKP